MDGANKTWPALYPLSFHSEETATGVARHCRLSHVTPFSKSLQVVSFKGHRGILHNLHHAILQRNELRAIAVAKTFLRFHSIYALWDELFTLSLWVLAIEDPTIAALVRLFRRLSTKPEESRAFYAIQLLVKAPFINGTREAFQFLLSCDIENLRRHMFAFGGKTRDRPMPLSEEHKEKDLSSPLLPRRAPIDHPLFKIAPCAETNPGDWTDVSTLLERVYRLVDGPPELMKDTTNYTYASIACAMTTVLLHGSKYKWRTELMIEKLGKKHDVEWITTSIRDRKFEPTLLHGLAITRVFLKEKSEAFQHTLPRTKTEMNKEISAFVESWNNVLPMDVDGTEGSIGTTLPSLDRFDTVRQLVHGATFDDMTPPLFHGTSNVDVWEHVNGFSLAYASQTLENGVELRDDVNEVTIEFPYLHALTNSAFLLQNWTEFCRFWCCSDMGKATLCDIEVPNDLAEAALVLLRGKPISSYPTVSTSHKKQRRFVCAQNKASSVISAELLAALRKVDPGAAEYKEAAAEDVERLFPEVKEQRVPQMKPPKSPSSKFATCTKFFESKGYQVRTIRKKEVPKEAGFDFPCIRVYVATRGDETLYIPYSGDIDIVKKRFRKATQKT